MALDPKKLLEVEKLLKSIDSIYKKISDKNPFEKIDISKIKDVDVEIEKLQKGLDEANIKLDNWEDSINGIHNSFKSIVSEISKSNTGLSLSKQSLNASAKVAAELRDHHMGIHHLSVKEIQNQKEKLKTSQQNLKGAQQILEEEKERLTNGRTLFQMSTGERSQLLQIKKALQANKRVIEDKDKLYETTFNRLNDAEKKEIQINKQLGIAGGLLKGISKIPIIGDLFNADEALKEMDKTLRDGKGSVSALGVGFKNMRKQIFDGMLNPANLVLGVIVGLIDGFAQSQKSIGELAKGLGMSASSATQMRQEFAGIANSSMNANISVKGLQDSQMAVGQALGTNAKLNREDLETMTDIVKKTGMQHKELMGIQKLSLAQGKSLDKNLKSTLGGATAYASQNKLVVDVNRTLKEVNNASSSLKLSLGGSVEELGRAVMQTQKFGITLQQAESISKGLLDFESSISAELEAELLTGKDINFEKARQFALEGDIAKASEEVLKQIKGSAEFTEMNVIQQEAMAKAVGMTRDQLADSLIEREALAKMSMAEGETALERYNDLKRQNKTQAEIVKILGEETAEKLEQQSAQDKFNASVEKLREVFVQVMDAVAPIFDVLSSIVSTVLPAINLILEPIRYTFEAIAGVITGNLEGLSTMQTILGGIVAAITAGYVVYKGIAKTMAIIKALKEAQNASTLKSIALSAKEAIIKKKNAIGDVISGAWKANGPIPFIGAILAAAAAVAGVAYINSQMQDGIIGPGGEMVVSGPKGSIQLDKDDSIIAGTNLFGDDKQQQPTQSQPSPQPQQASVDMSQTNALLQQLISVIQSGGDVMLDGQKVGTALKLGTYQTQ
jgi:hypothetical protein